MLHRHQETTRHTTFALVFSCKAWRKPTSMHSLSSLGGTLLTSINSCPRIPAKLSLSTLQCESDA